MQISSVGAIRRLADYLREPEGSPNFRLLARIMEQTSDSVILTDTKGVIQYVNLTFETTTGYCKDEALGKTPRILKSGPP